MHSEAANLIQDAGLTIGWDSSAPPLGYNGVILLTDDETALDPRLVGPSPTMGIYAKNPYAHDAQVLGMPTNLQGTLTAPTDRHYVGCMLLPIGFQPPGIPYAGLRKGGGPPPSVPSCTPQPEEIGPRGPDSNFYPCRLSNDRLENDTTDYTVDGTIYDGEDPSVSGELPSSARDAYRGELNPVNHARASSAAYTSMSGGKMKPICSCGKVAAGAQDAGGSVNVVNGEFVARFTPLQISAARGEDWIFNVTYRTLSPNATHINAPGVADLGYHWDYSIGKYLTPHPNGDMEFHDGDGLVALYKKIATVGTLTTFETPVVYYDTLTYDSATDIAVRTDRHGRVERYEDGRLIDITDRNGNTKTFTYSSLTNRLVSSTDAHHRMINFTYDASGRLKEIVDFAGRKVTFVYCSGNTLCKIKGLGGTSVTFTYDANGAMKDIYDANGVRYLRNWYSDEYQVSIQRYGDKNQTYLFAYRPDDATTTVYDRNRNRVDYHYEGEVPFTSIARQFNNRRVDPLSANFHETTYERNAYLEITRITYPNTNEARYVFDELNVLPLARGNLLQVTRDPGRVCLSGPDGMPFYLTGALDDPIATVTGLLESSDSDPYALQHCRPRTTLYTHEALFNQVATVTDARGMDPLYTPQNGGSTSPARYLTRYFFDYEEALLGDLNGDGILTQDNGNIVRVTKPIVNPAGTPDGFSAQAANQAMMDTYTYNAFGQVTSHKNALGVKETYTYFPSAGGTYYPEDSEGFVKEHFQDTAGWNLRTNFTYDIVGDVTSVTNPAGQRATFQYDNRCLLTNSTSPATFTYQDKVYPRAKHAGDDSLTTSKQRTAVADKVRLSYALTSTEADRDALMDDWASLPNNITWLLLSDAEQNLYLNNLQIYEYNGDFLRNGIDGTYLGGNRFEEFDAPNPPILRTTGTWRGGMELTKQQKEFLVAETKARDVIVAETGGLDAEASIPLQVRKLTLAAEWTLGTSSTKTHADYDANGQPTRILTQTDSQGIDDGAVRTRPAPKIATNDYNELGKVLVDRVETTAELPTAAPGNKSITQYFYDFNENLVCKYFPMRVQENRMRNIERWVFDERDHEYRHDRAKITGKILVNAGRDASSPFLDPNIDTGIGACQTACHLQNPVTAQCSNDEATATTQRWDGNGNMVLSIDARGVGTYHLFNGFDEKVTTIDALGNRAETYYDPLGAVVRERRLEPRVAQGFLNDVMMNWPAATLTIKDFSRILAGIGLLDAENYRLLSQGDSKYDEAARKFAATRLWFGQPSLLPELLQTPSEVSDYTEHDALNRVIRSINANGHVSTTQYDALNRVTKTTDAVGNFVAKTYDKNGNVIKEVRHDVSPDGYALPQDFIVTRDYDAQNRLVNETDNRGHKKHYSYDAQGQQKAEQDSDVTPLGDNAANVPGATANAIKGHVEKHLKDGAGRAIVDYTRMGIKWAGTNITFDFTLDGVSYALKDGMDHTGLILTIKHCSYTGCVSQGTCTLTTDPACVALLETNCAYVAGNPSTANYPGCCSPSDVKWVCVRMPAESHLENDTVTLAAWQVIPWTWKYQCYQETWPNFMCWYTGPFREFLEQMNCTRDLPVTCTDTTPVAKDYPCRNPHICGSGAAGLDGDIPAQIPTYDNGTLVRAYPGPYWDQYAEGGTWDGSTYYFGITTRQGWDRNGRLVSRTDGEGNAMRYAYDDLNRQTREAYPAPPGPIPFMMKVYDANDNVKAIHDMNGNVITNTHDALNRLIDVELDQAPGVVGTDHQAYTYDGLGRKLTSLDENSTNPNSRVTASWVYDSLGNAVSETTQGFRVVSHHDAASNRVLTQYPGNRLVNRTHDALERLVAIQDLVPAMVAGLPVYLEVELAQYHYVGHRLVNRTYANGVNRTYEYRDFDASGNLIGNNTRPYQVLDKFGSQILLGWDYSYDAKNNKESVKRLHAPALSEAYGLDAAYRLVDYDRGTLTGNVVTTPAATGVKSQEWALTDANNWAVTATTTGSTSVDARTHNVRNQVTSSASSPTYTYDLNGNMREDIQKSYRWDAKNRLVQVINKATNTQIAAYQYDADNRRVSITGPSPAVVTRFVLDGQHEIEERTSSGALARQYVFGPGVDEVILRDENLLAAYLYDQPIAGTALGDLATELGLEYLGAEPRGSICTPDGSLAPPPPQVCIPFSRRFYYHLDDQHSTIALTDEDGDLREGYEYTPYGLPRVYGPSASGIDWTTTLTGSQYANHVLYTGRSWDPATGLHYYRTRYMSPTLGRFISSDTIGVWGDATGLGNGYVYGGMRAHIASDPFGTLAILFLGLGNDADDARPRNAQCHDGWSGLGGFAKCLDSKVAGGARAFTWTEFGPALEAVLAAKRDEPLHVIGHSMGGNTAYRFATYLGDQFGICVDYLVTVDGANIDGDSKPRNVGKWSNYYQRRSSWWTWVLEGVADGADENVRVKGVSHTGIDDSVWVQDRIAGSIAGIEGKCSPVAANRAPSDPCSNERGPGTRTYHQGC